jgi:hypothetical protein
LTPEYLRPVVAFLGRPLVDHGLVHWPGFAAIAAITLSVTS